MKYFFFVLALCLSQFLNAQSAPVSWDFQIEQKSEDTYVITSTASIDADWVLYSQYTEEGGPVPTSFTYDGVELVGKTNEMSELIKKYSALFDLEVSKFENEAIFTQEIKVKSGTTSVKGYVTYMCCNGKQCLPPTDVDFELKL